MLIWPDVREVDSRDEEDDPQGQQHQQAVPNRHHALVVTVGCCVGLCSCLLVVEIMTIAAAPTWRQRQSKQC